MTRRPLLALLTLVALVALIASAAGCGSSSAGSGTSTTATRPVKLILDWFPNADHAGIYGAIDQGYFARQRLAVTPSVPSDPSAALKQVGAGRAPFAISYEPDVLLARAQGVPVVAVGAVVTHPLNSVIARTDRGIRRPRDLQGKTVGIAGVPSDRPLLDEVVRGDGGDPSKVNVRTVGFSLSPALAAGKVDAIIGAYWNIELVELHRHHVPVTAFRLERYGVPDYNELVVVTSDQVAHDQPALVRSFLAGLRGGQDWAARNQAAAVVHLVKANPDLDAATVAQQVRLTAGLLSPSDSPTLAVRPAEWAAFAAWMRRTGLLSGSANVSGAVSDRFLPGATS